MSTWGCGNSSSAASPTSPPVPDFSFTATPSTLNLNAGGTSTLTIFSSALNGFSGSLAVSLTGLPSGVTASPAAISLPSSGSQIVTLTASASAAIGSSIPLTIQANSGSITHTASLSLNVLGPQSFSFSLQPSPLSVIAGAMQTASVGVTGTNGFNGLVTAAISGLPAGVTVSPSTLFVNSGSTQTVTFTASSTATGSGSVVLSGTSGSLTNQAQFPISVSTTPDFQISTNIFTATSVTSGAASSFTVSAKSYNGFASPVAVSITGLPAGVTASPATFSINPGATQTVNLTAALTAPASQTTITVQGTSGSLSHQSQVQLGVLLPSMTLQVQPGSISIPAGSSSSVGLQIYGLASNSTGSVAVSITNLPSGVTAPQSSFIYPASGGSTTIYFAAAATGAQNGTIKITAVYGPVTNSASVAIAIGPASGNTPVALKSRTKYIRTDATSPYPSYPPPNWTIYHSPTARFFASDPSGNRVNVFDSANRILIASIIVPGAFGMDQAPDGSVIYVGTESGDLYLVDPVKLAVTKRYPSDTISPYGFSANAVYALANGKLLLERYLLLPGYSWVDGNGPLALWNPADNSLVEFNGPDSVLNIPLENTCLAEFEYGILTNNRSRILLTPILTSQGSSILCSLDPNSDTWVLSPVMYDGGNSALATLAVSPDGTTVTAFDGARVYVLDAATLKIKSSFTTGSSQTLFSYPSMLISADNTSVYLSGASNNQLLYVYNLTTGLQTGWLPEPQLEAQDSYTPSVPYMQAISSNGLIGGVMEQGFGFIDVSTVNPMPVGTAFGVVPMLGPTSGPAAGSTDTSWWQSPASSAGVLSLGSVYFGTNAATAVSASNTGSKTIYATSPAGTSGVVDIYTLTPDGGEQILPEAFSYGPSILEAPTGYATAEGGGNAQVYGYGLGSSYIPNLSQQIVAPPVDLGITIGNTRANITGYLPGPFSADSYFTLPFPLVGAEFTIPSGVAGSTVDLNITNSNGSTTLKQALTYLPPTKTYPVDGHLLDGTYDSRRDVYYFTDANQIRVFSRSKGWLVPIPVPPITGAIGPERLLGIALSPDNSRLIVSDAGGIAIDVIDVDNPANIKGYSIGTLLFFQPITETPSGVAITNAGQIYFTTFDQNGDGSPYLIHIDPATGKADFPSIGDFAYLQTEGAYQYGRLPITADGSRIYFNNAGQVGYIDTVTGKGIFASQTGNLGQVGYDVYLSPNQTSVYADGFLMDSQMAVRGFQSLNYRESFDADYVYGATLSPDGTLLFQPGADSIDVFDGRTGVFRTRISLSVTLSPNYRALVGDRMDNVQVAITGATGTGIAVIDLNTIPEPNPLPYPEVAGSTHASASPPSTTQFRAKPRAITHTLPALAKIIKHRTTSLAAFTH